MPWIVGGAIVGGALLGANASKKAANAQGDAADAASRTQMQMFEGTQRNLAPWMQAGQLSLEQLMGLTQPKTSAAIAAIPKPTMQEAEDEHLRNHVAQYGSGYTTDSDMSIKDLGVRQIHERNMKNYEAQVAAANAEAAAAQPVAAAPTDQGPMSGPLLKPFGMEDFQESPAYQFNLNEGRKAIEKAAASRGTLYAPATLQDIGKYSQGVASNEFQNAFSNYNTNMKNVWDRLYALSGTGQNAAATQGAFGTTVGGQIGENMTGAGNAQAAGIVGQSNAFTGAMGQGLSAYQMNQILANNQRGSVPMSSLAPQNIPGAGDLNQFYA